MNRRGRGRGAGEDLADVDELLEQLELDVGRPPALLGDVTYGTASTCLDMSSESARALAKSSTSSRDAGTSTVCRT